MGRAGAMIRAKIRQRPVGQGGLCEGWLVEPNRPPFRWVYDCGSNQTVALNREINRVGGPLDLLFLSHLDNDHVNGVDALLTTCPTQEVVLPYLNDDERIVLIAAAASAGALSGSYLTFASDPAAWLLNRGVERVTFIRGGDDGEGVDRELPDFDKPGPEGRVARDPAERLHRVWSASHTSTASGSIQEIPAGAALSVLATSGFAIWTLLPQAHRPGPRLVRAFRDELALQLGPMSPADAGQAACTPSGREALVACYEKIWSDHNLITLSLYAGPHHADVNDWRADVWARPLRRVAREARSVSGWISTGDAKLSVKARRSAFHRFFQPYLATTAVLVTPHHGAATSWHDDVLDGFEALRIGCAAAGRNGYDHPNQQVIAAIEAHRHATFVQVADDDRSDVLLEVRRPWHRPPSVFSRLAPR